MSNDHQLYRENQAEKDKISSVTRILLIEDSADDELLLTRALKRQGVEFELTRIEELADLRRRLRQQWWDIILSDFRLATFTAKDALAIVQQLTPALPFIVISGALGDEMAVELIKLGVDDYLIKDRLSRIRIAIEHAIEQRRMARAQQLNEAKLQAIFDHTQDVIMVIDAQTKVILEVNQAVSAQLAYQPDELIGRRFSSICLMDNMIGFEEMGSAAAPQTLKQLSQEIIDATGQIKLMDIQFSTITWPVESAVLVTLHDVTERERAAAAKRDAHQLKTALQKERELNSWRSEVIKILSHEFRTPLTAIHISSDLLSKYYEKLTAERRSKYAENIKKQSDFLLQMLDDFVLADSNTFSFAPEQLVRCDPDAFIRDRLIDLQKTLQTERDIRYEHVGHNQEYELCPEPLGKIVDELLNNAISYSAPGSPITVQLTTSSSHIGITVSDYGVGIPAEDQQQIFKPFYRAKNVQVKRGLGLGLYNIKKLIGFLEGDIELVSELNEGTTVRINLPAHGFIHAVSNST